MARVFVEIHLGNYVGALSPNQSRMWGEGMDSVDPPLRFGPTVKTAFQAGSPEIEVVGEKVNGIFRKSVDKVVLKGVKHNLTAIRYMVYDFGGWAEK